MTRMVPTKILLNGNTEEKIKFSNEFSDYYNSQCLEIENNLEHFCK